MITLSEIALTGSTGTIGSCFPTSCHPLDLRMSFTTDEMIACIQRCPTRPKAIVHLAAVSTQKACADDLERCFEVNVNGSLRLFQAAAKAGVERFVFVSTSHVYKDPGGEIFLTEESPVGPTSDYGKSKLLAEQKLQNAALGENSIHLTIARVFSVLSKNRGPDFLWQGLKKRIELNPAQQIPGLDNVRDCLWDYEVAEQLIRLSTILNPPPLALVCSGKPRSIRSIAEQICVDLNINSKNLSEDKMVPPGIRFLAGRPTLPT